MDWTNDCVTAFATLKESLCSALVLSPPDYSRPFILQTDASRFGIGAVLAQETVNSEEHPIAYYSRKMQPREHRYSAAEQEELAIVNACMHFTPYLLAHPFTVATDFIALSFLALKDPQLLSLTLLDGHIMTVHLLHQVSLRKR